MRWSNVPLALFSPGALAASRPSAAESSISPDCRCPACRSPSNRSGPAPARCLRPRRSSPMRTAASRSTCPAGDYVLTAELSGFSRIVRNVAAGSTPVALDLTMVGRHGRTGVGDGAGRSDRRPAAGGGAGNGDARGHGRRHAPQQHVRRCAAAAAECGARAGRPDQRRGRARAAGADARQRRQRERSRARRAGHHAAARSDRIGAGAVERLPERIRPRDRRRHARRDAAGVRPAARQLQQLRSAAALRERRHPRHRGVGAELRHQRADREGAPLVHGGARVPVRPRFVSDAGGAAGQPVRRGAVVDVARMDGGREPSHGGVAVGRSADDRPRQHQRVHAGGDRSRACGAADGGRG